MANFRGTDPKTDPDGGSTSLNALAFSTLLSSQETDAHHREILVSQPGLISFFVLHHRRGDFFNLPEMFFRVKSGVPIKIGIDLAFKYFLGHWRTGPSEWCFARLPPARSARARVRNLVSEGPPDAACLAVTKGALTWAGRATDRSNNRC